MTRRAVVAFKKNADVSGLLKALKKAYPNANCELDHRNPLELLVATILSAQCTDKRVNLVTKTLFQKYRTPADYAVASPTALEADIRSTGFYRNKTKNIRGMAQRLLDFHEGHVPETMDALLALPGVARKTANVVLGTVFKKAVGVVVDTHVMRLSARLGLSKEKTPEKIERDLMAQIPQSNWIWLSHALIWHGRRVCDARRPRCFECPLRRQCANPAFPS